jgi:hypothetical protein
MYTQLAVEQSQPVWGTQVHYYIVWHKQGLYVTGCPTMHHLLQCTCQTNSCFMDWQHEQFLATALHMWLYSLLIAVSPNKDKYLWQPL